MLDFVLGFLSYFCLGLVIYFSIAYPIDKIFDKKGI